jgi:hypothetical protein
VQPKISNEIKLVGFEVFSCVILEIAAFWVVMLYSSETLQTFRSNIASIFRVREYAKRKLAEHSVCFRWILFRLVFEPEDEGDMLWQKRRPLSEKDSVATQKTVHF